MNDPRHFQRAHRIRFAECDPAGIVFYPQYFVLFNGLVEDWIDCLLPEVGGFAGTIAKEHCGLPVVRLEAEFKAISRMGDEVVLSLDVTRLGHKSLTLALACCDRTGQPRMQAVQTIVTTSLDTHAAITIPNYLRRALETKH